MSERDVRPQREHVQQRGRVAQRAVGEDLERVERPVAARVQHPAARARPATRGSSSAACGGTRPRSSPAAARARSRAGSYRARQPRLTRLKGNDEVVAGARVEAQVGLAPDGVDRAVAGGHRGEPALERADGGLVAPVGALLVGRRPAPRYAAARRRSRRAGRANGAHQRRSASGSQSALASENARTSPVARLDRSVLCADLALPRRGRGPARARSGRGGRARSSTVRSADPSEATISSSCSGG